MHKLSLKLLNKIIKNCTGTEFMFVIYLTTHQDYYGLVRNVYYKDVADVLGIHQKHFYDILESLERKNIIEVDRINSSYRYWTIRLLNNVFRTFDDELLKQDQQKSGGYLDLNLDFIFTPEFMKLKAKEKKLAVLLLRFKDKQFASAKDKLMAWISETDRKKFKCYMKNLEQWFVIKLEKDVSGRDKYIIVLKKQYHKAEWTAEIKGYNQKLIEFCRRLRIKFDIKNLNDIAALIRQYKQSVKKLGKDIINILTIALFAAKDKYNSINAAAVHSELTAKISELERSKKEEKKNPPQEPEIKPKRTFNNFKNREYDPKEIKAALIRRSRGELLPE